jgi:hypothetical protein
VGNIDSHSHFVHALDNRQSVVGESFVAPLGGTIADERARIVSEMRDSLAESVKVIHVVDFSEVLGILQAEQYGPAEANSVKVALGPG